MRMYVATVSLLGLATVDVDFVFPDDGFSGVVRQEVILSSLDHFDKERLKASVVSFPLGGVVIKLYVQLTGEEYKELSSTMHEQQHHELLRQLKELYDEVIARFVLDFVEKNRLNPEMTLMESDLRHVLIKK